MSVVTVDDAIVAIDQIGGEWTRDEKREDFLRRVGRQIGMPFHTVRAIYYRRRKRLYAEEAATLAAKLSALQERRARNETAYAELAARAVARGCAAPVEGNGESPGSSGPASSGGRDADRGAEEAAAAGRSGAPGADERQAADGL